MDNSNDSALQALKFVEQFTEKLFPENDEILRVFAFNLHSIINFKNVLFDEITGKTHAIALIGTIEWFSKHHWIKSFRFSNCIFLILKYDLFITKDHEFNSIINLKLVNSLMYIYILPEASLSIDKIKSYNTFFDFSSYASSLSELLKDKILTHDVPYEVLWQELAAESHRSRESLAARLAPALNARIRREDMPHDTLEQKKEVARWVNDQLVPLGLAVQEPKTGLPGKLRGMAGHWPDVGRFGIEIYVDGKQKTPTVSDTLPELTLMDATPQKGPEKDWQQAVGLKEKRRGHTRS